MGLKLGSSIYSNSFAQQDNNAYSPRQQGNSFYGLSKPQYASNTYYALANNGAGASSDGRAARYNRANFGYTTNPAIVFGLNK
jgi:hypothetical protein